MHYFIRLLCLLLPVSVLAQSERPPAWLLKNGQQQAVLLGSIHMGTADMYPLPKALEQAYQQADMLVVELDLSQVDPTEASQLMLSKGMYPTVENNLKQQLDDKTWQLLNEVADQFGLPIEFLQQQKPWMVVMTLSQYMALQMGLEEQYGVDLHFIEQAHNQNKTIIELESLVEQIGFFDQLSEAEQIQLLSASLQQFKTDQVELTRLIDHWRNGHLSELEQLINAAFVGEAELDKVFEVLFVERNKNMATQIHGLLEQGHSPFVVVGAGHLLGNGSVVDLLRQQGYTLERF